MPQVLVRYKVKADKVAENESLVKAVYKQLHENPIAGFHYVTLKLADRVSFVHIAFADTEQINAAFTGSLAFKQFQANIKERCDELPVAGPVSVVGAFDFSIGSM